MKPARNSVRVAIDREDGSISLIFSHGGRSVGAAMSPGGAAAVGAMLTHAAESQSDPALEAEIKGDLL